MNHGGPRAVALEQRDAQVGEALEDAPAGEARGDELGCRAAG